MIDGYALHHSMWMACSEITFIEFSSSTFPWIQPIKLDVDVTETADRAFQTTGAKR